MATQEAIDAAVLAIRGALAAALWLIVFALAARGLRPVAPRGGDAFSTGVAACCASVSALLLWATTGGFRGEHDGIEPVLGAALWATAVVIIMICARLSWQNILEIMGIITLKTQRSLGRKLLSQDESTDTVGLMIGHHSSGMRLWQGNILAYCPSCGEQRPMVYARPVLMRDGRSSTEGRCSICGARMLKIGGGA